jgi:hypothetical protein
MLLILGMAAVVATIIAWGIIPLGVRALGREGRRGRWQTMLQWLALFGCLPYAVWLSYLSGFLENSEFPPLLPAMPTFIITLCLFILYATVFVIELRVQWPLWRAPKYRRNMIISLVLLIDLLRLVVLIDLMLSGAIFLTLLIFALNGVYPWSVIAPALFPGGPP